ncbi:MAG: DUF2062 domain-containing protein [Chitinivibrionales bacterium]|nr:DUF2062 domain-containing protein [Chitinivibrionales bacterium]
MLNKKFSEWPALFRPLGSISIPGNSLKEKIVYVVRHELRANTSPLYAARSLAIGVFFGFSPIYGFQVAAMLALSMVLRINRPIAFLGICVSIPPLLPFVILAAIFTGKMVLAFLGMPVDTIVANKWAGGGIAWFFGSWILAIVGSVTVFAASYLLLKAQKKSKRVA